jgi:phosphoglucosamine mutase
MPHNIEEEVKTVAEVPPVRCLFGTDGVRDVANQGAMTPEMALRLGRAYVLFLLERRGVPRPRIVVGRDTRRSGAMLEASLLGGMTSAGAEILALGTIPTPGVSFACRETGADGGAMISASHNPAEYNGIKFLDREGAKLSDGDEAAIEEFLEDSLMEDWRPTGASVGDIRPLPLWDSYVSWLRGLVPSSRERSRLGELLVDCAHGAASGIPERLFDGEAVVVGDRPDGLNINENVGVMHMETLRERVREKGASLGIAFDGDADRVLFCDAKGRALDGDILLWVLARWLASRNALGSGVVATVMSNMALEARLEEANLRVFRCPVGDRYVLEEMRERASRLGGEQSGHVILSDWVRTGDGLCTGLLFLRACLDLQEDPQTLVDRFGRYPQKLRNVRVRDKRLVLEHRRVQGLLSEAEGTLERRGRIVLRPSGTEPLVRVLVEAEDPERMERVLDRVVRGIEDVVKEVEGA